MDIKKFLAASLAAAAVFGGTVSNYSSAPVSSAAFSFESWEDNNKEVVIGDFSFVVNTKSRTAILEKYSGKDKEAVIPDSVDGVPVKTIACNAFANNDTLESVVIPASVWDISGFLNCTALRSVTIENNPNYKTGIIRQSAFEGCKALESITIPECFDTVMENAFADCTSLAEIIFPEHKMTLNKYSFCDTPWYKTLKADEDGFVRFKDLIIDVVNASGELVIPDDAVEIAAFLCYKNNDITSVVIPKGVELVGAGAFYGCENLETVTIKSKNCRFYDNSVFANKLIVPQKFDISELEGFLEGLGEDISGWENIQKIVDNYNKYPEYKEYFDKLNEAVKDFTESQEDGSARSLFMPQGSFEGRIVGYKSSSAEKFAEKNNAEFEFAAMKGDVNKDGVADSIDASKLLQMYTKMSTSDTTLTDDELYLYDVNSDGIVDSVDASCILAYYAANSTDRANSQLLEEFIANK